MPRPCVRFATLLAVFLSVSLFAQTYTPKKFVFVNPGPFTDAQLLASSGMKVGQPFTVEDLQKACQSMIDSGAFEELVPTLDGPFKAITVIFKFKPVAKEKFLPTEFENFVWFSSKELSDGLHARVPLYANGIPEAGNLNEQVRKALTEMVTEKGVADPEILVVEREPSAALPTSAWAYSVNKPAIMLAGVTLSGVSAEMQPKVDEYLHTIVGKLYQQGHGADTDDVILDIYRDEGYIDAKMTDLQRLPVTTSPGNMDVKLTGNIVPGAIYRIKKVEWSGSPMLSAEDFTKENPLHSGDIAARKQLNASVKIVEDAYKHNGYLFVAVDPHGTLDAATRTVTYSYTVTPGDQYRMGDLSVVGLPPDVVEEFNATWKMKSGDIYDGTYIGTYLRKNIANDKMKEYGSSFHMKADTNTHLVNVEMVFHRMPSRRRR